MLIRSRSPLRLGLAGGGTDVSPYSDLFGGAILNATIGQFAYATIEPHKEGKITLNAVDRNEHIQYPVSKSLFIDGKLDLLKGVYNRVIKQFEITPQPFTLTTHVDAPPGSGLGSSSTLVVAILGAFVEWFKLPLGEYDIAHLAYEIERVDLGMAGGKQDQYAATFGGFNFMEFYADDKVIVNPLRVKNEYLHEIESCLLLYFTETSRLSSKIIEAQTENVNRKNEASIEAMHQLKEQARWMKEVVLKGEVAAIGEILKFGWQHKKKMASGISNPLLDEIYETAISAGASGGKISGAGGGGFMVFYCPATTKNGVVKALSQFGGGEKKFNFTKNGLTTWTI